jgi:hypothetical protein
MPDADDTEKTSVPACPLDSLPPLQKLDRLDLVKLDVEGSDLHALRGMKDLLKRYRPALIVERHDVYGYYQLNDLTALLTELGYQWREVKYLTAPYLVCTPAGD